MIAQKETFDIKRVAAEILKSWNAQLLELDELGRTTLTPDMGLMLPREMVPREPLSAKPFGAPRVSSTATRRLREEDERHDLPPEQRKLDQEPSFYSPPAATPTPETSYTSQSTTPSS